MRTASLRTSSVPRPCPLRNCTSVPPSLRPSRRHTLAITEEPGPEPDTSTTMLCLQCMILTRTAPAPTPTVVPVAWGIGWGLPPAVRRAAPREAGPAVPSNYTPLRHLPFPLPPPRSCRCWLLARMLARLRARFASLCWLTRSRATRRRGRGRCGPTRLRRTCSSRATRPLRRAA